MKLIHVDDFFIFFNTKDNMLNKVLSRIKSTVIHNLRAINLNLNEQKSNSGLSENVSEELSAALYEHYVNKEHIDISSMFGEDQLNVFIDKIQDAVEDMSHNHAEYEVIKRDAFKISGVKYSENEVFQYLIYYNKTIFKNTEFVRKLRYLIRSDYKIIKYDTKNFINMILYTQDGYLIKFFLNELFQNQDIDSFDISMMVTYLVMRNFNHKDLLNKLNAYEPIIYDFIQVNCKTSFIESILDEENNTYINLLFEKKYDYRSDIKVWYIYFMYHYYKNSNDILEAFSYFKSYFDRITAHIMNFKEIETSGKKNKPNYKKYYKDKVIIKDFNKIQLKNN